MSAPARPEGAIGQSVSIAFRGLIVAVALVAIAWAASGVTQVEPGDRAVIERFGSIDREVEAGLVLAWPRPIEDVVAVPGRDRQLTMPVSGLMAADAESPIPSDYVMTGDGGVALLKGTLSYHVTAPRDYVLTQARVEPALARLFAEAAIANCAHRALDQVLVATPPGGDAGALEPTAESDSAAAEREQLRADIVAAINARAGRLRLGVEVTRLDLLAILPHDAQAAFESVATAASDAATEIAHAQAERASMAQMATDHRTKVISKAQSDAQELVSQAHRDTDQIAALLKESTPQRRALMLTQVYRDRIEKIIMNATVTVVDGSEPIRLGTSGQ